MNKNDNFNINQLLWNIAGFRKDIIKDCKVDSYHATIIGALLLMVGIYATLAWMFFFDTVFHNTWISLVAGLFMGLFIVSFDRALIASLSSGAGNWFSLAFRILLALLLGVFLSQPMILKFYEPEIKREAQILVDKKVNERKKELENLYAMELSALNTRKKELEDGIANKKIDLDSSAANFTKEMDGSGGSGKVGYSAISKKKEKIFADNQAAYNTQVQENKPELENIQRQLDTIRNNITNKIEVFKAETAEFGTLVQAEALESLIQKDKSKSLRNRYYLLGIILTLIELSALIAKIFFKTKSYSSKVSALTEEEEKNAEINKEIAFAKLDKYKNLSLEADLKSIDDFFAKSKSINDQKMNELVQEWKDNKESSYKDYWARFKKMFMIHE